MDSWYILVLLQSGLTNKNGEDHGASVTWTYKKKTHRVDLGSTKYLSYQKYTQGIQKMYATVDFPRALIESINFAHFKTSFCNYPPVSIYRTPQNNVWRSGKNPGKVINYRTLKRLLYLEDNHL